MATEWEWVDFDVPWKPPRMANTMEQLFSAHSVGELLPAGHEVYLRVFHPFVPWDWDDDSAPVPPTRRTTWRALADKAGCTFGPTLTWRQLEAVLSLGDNGREFSVMDGTLERGTATALFDLLVHDGGTGPYFAGWGLSAIIGTDDHEPMLFTTTVFDLETLASAVRDRAGYSLAGPEWVWPSDERWLVSTDYDLTSTYVALSRSMAERVLADPTIEACRVEIGTRIDDKADEQDE